MNVAIILAGGCGRRMQQEIPKQFIDVDGKPVIIYTLEAFQKHPEIDSILVVCIDGWHDILREHAQKHNITKLKWIINGGNSAQESIYCGVDFLSDKCSENDIAVIHDGIRPLIDEDVLSDVIKTCQIHGNAVTSMDYNEQIFIKHDEKTTKAYIPRETLRRVSTPQAYRYPKLLWAYRKAFTENIGIHGSAYTNTMMADLGETLYFASGSDKNIKLTTPDDLAIFRAMLKIKEQK